MAITPTEFFNRNLKWFALALLLLFLYKTMQSCNRKTLLSKDSKEYVHEIDSLKNKYNIYYKDSQDSIKKLNYELKLANQNATAADERATAVQNAVEKIRSNTTVVVKGVEEVKNDNKNK